MKSNTTTGLFLALIAISFPLATHCIVSAIDRNTEMQRARMCFDHPDLFGLEYCAGVREGFFSDGVVR